MRLTPGEAMALLANVSEHYDQLQAEASKALATRDQLLVVLDGQEGMTRTGMADAAGINRTRVHQIVQAAKGAPDREQVEEGQTVDDQLADSIREVFTRFEGPITGRLAEDRYRATGRIDVSA